MSSLLERAPVHLAPVAKIEGIKRLSEIERPYGMSIVLGLDRNALMIDDQIVIGYKNTFTPQFHHSTRELHVSRELTFPIKIEKDGSEVCYPNRDEAKLSADFGTLYIGLRKQRPVCYIGEKYKLTYIWTLQSGIIFRIDSTHPFEGVDKVAGNDNYDEVLRQEYLKREWKRIIQK